MGDLHQVVVNHIGQVIGREAVRFEQDQVVQLRAVVGDLAANQVVEYHNAVVRDLEPDNVRSVGCQKCLHLCFGHKPALTVIT